MLRAALVLLGVTAVATFVGSLPVAAQCPLQWQPGDPIPFAHGDATATIVWDPDGAGPAPAVLVAGGRFAAGTTPTTSLAAFDGSSWISLGAPPIPAVTALTTWNGLLVAAGGTGNQHTVATWNGTSWVVLGTTNGRIHTMAVWNGDLFVGGLFSSMNGAQARNIARWNGATWSEPGLGITGQVHAMAVFGSLYVGGTISQAGTVSVSHLAIWNGTAWSAGATFDATVFALAARSGTTPSTSFLFAGGTFSHVNGAPAPKVAQFSASTGLWTALPALPGSKCRALHVRSTSLTTLQLHAAVEDASSDHKVWRLSGTSWISLGAVSDESELLPTSLAFFNGQYVAAFETLQISESRLLKAVRIHDGTAWQPARGPGFDERIHALTSLGNDLVVAGRFRNYGSTPLERIARGAPGAWQPLGAGIGGGLGVFALCTLSNGDLVAGGDFTSAGGINVPNIARWDGSNWQPLGLGTNGAVRALLALPNGDLVAAGAFTIIGGAVANHVARWTGSVWVPLGSGTNGSVLALCRLSNGDLIAAGSFTTAGGAPAARIARWNGLSWSPLGSGLDDVGQALAVLPGDHIVVGGFFAAAGGISSPSVARWDGAAWHAQSSTSTAWDADIGALVAIPNGDYFAAGLTSFFGPLVGGVSANVARHVGDPTSLLWNAADLVGFEVAAALLMPGGDLVFGGNFDGAGGLASHDVAVLRPTCPAAVASHGSGCTGAGGANVLVATSPPWAGSTFRGLATGMPANGIVLAVTGFTPLAVPMPAVLPQGVPGCTLLVSPDLLDAALATAGTVATQVALPNTPALGGQLFYHQVVPLEFDLAGNLVGVTATNGLTLTIGAL